MVQNAAALWNHEMGLLYQRRRKINQGIRRIAVRGAGPQRKRPFRDPAPPRLSKTGPYGGPARRILRPTDIRSDRTVHAKPNTTREIRLPVHRGEGTLHLHYINKAGIAVCQDFSAEFSAKIRTPIKSRERPSRK